MQSNPEIQKLQADVQTEADKTNTAAEILRKAMINAGGLIVTGAEDIRANFNKGLASSLLGIVDDINNIRIKVFGQATETRLPVAENGNISFKANELAKKILTEGAKLNLDLNINDLVGPTANLSDVSSTIRNRPRTMTESLFDPYFAAGIPKIIPFMKYFDKFRGFKPSSPLESENRMQINKNNETILELLRQLQQLRNESRVQPTGPQTPMTPLPSPVGGARDQSSTKLEKSISDLILSVADLKSTIDSKQSIVDGVAVANFNTAVNKLNETTIKVAHNFDVNQDIRMDVAGDVTLSPETIAAISSDIRNQTNNAIAINIRNLETFGSRRQV
jgi:hypothetical protein